MDAIRWGLALSLSFTLIIGIIAFTLVMREDMRDSVRVPKEKEYPADLTAPCSYCGSDDHARGSGVRPRCQVKESDEVPTSEH